MMGHLVQLKTKSLELQRSPEIEKEESSCFLPWNVEFNSQGQRMTISS